MSQFSEADVIGSGTSSSIYIDKNDKHMCFKVFNNLDAWIHEYKINQVIFKMLKECRSQEFTYTINTHTLLLKQDPNHMKGDIPILHLKRLYGTSLTEFYTKIYGSNFVEFFERLKDTPRLSNGDKYRLCVDILLCILNVLRVIHTFGIYHCDIKPHNIMISNKRKVKLIDFGIAKNISFSDTFGREAAALYDVWQTGFLMKNFIPPFNSCKKLESLYNVVERNFPTGETDRGSSLSVDQLLLLFTSINC